MMSKLVGLYGASGFGREVMPLLRQQIEFGADSSTELVFVDDSVEDTKLNGHRVLKYCQFLDEPATEKSVSIAIADGKVRKRLSDRLTIDKIKQISVKAPTSIVGDLCSIGEGAIVSDFTILTGNLSIGAHFHANIYSYVAHDCIIGNFVTFAPGVKCNGNIVIEDFAYIGTGAILKQGRPGAPLVIGTGAIVGMGAVVTKDVAANSIVVGNPAAPIKR